MFVFLLFNIFNIIYYYYIFSLIFSHITSCSTMDNLPFIGFVIRRSWILAVLKATFLAPLPEFVFVVLEFCEIFL